MEDVRKYLETSTESDSEPELRNDYFKSKKCKEENRLPTRRPNPNIYNRNALLARENRRRKKAHLETIEKELEEVRSTNRMLVKELKRRSKSIKRLEQEKLYFKSIVINQTEITQIVKAINTHLPLQHSNGTTDCLKRRVTSPENFGLNSGGSSSRSYDTETSVNFDKSDNGTVIASSHGCEQQLVNTSSNFFDFDFSTDFETSSVLGATWKELLEDGIDHVGGSTESSSPVYTDHINYNISDDHSYVSQKDTVLNNVDGDTGICLHITGHKVSLEFCPSCHWNSSHTSPIDQENIV